MKTLFGFVFVILVLIFTGSLSKASNEKQAIYSWDVMCKGPGKFNLIASQSDDNFYINVYQEGESQTVPSSYSVTPDYEPNEGILFFSAPATKKTPLIWLQIYRENLTGFGLALGKIELGKKEYDLNCYVRYGVNEQDFDVISNKPFPDFARPE